MHLLCHIHYKVQYAHKDQVPLATLLWIAEAMLEMLGS